MKKFLLIYRSAMPTTQPSPDEMQRTMEEWTVWLREGLASKIIAEIGDSLKPDGCVLTAGGGMTDGPYMENKEVSGGFSIAQGNSIEDILDYVRRCPSLNSGGSVEIRPMTGVGEMMTSK